MKTLLRSTVVAALAFAASLAGISASAQETIELKLWSRADPSGPLRPGNILKGAERLNAQLEKDGADYRVSITVLEQPDQGGYDGDAERLLRAYAIGEGPDIFHAAHEWICAFADPGFLFDLTDFTNDHPEFFADIFPSLWASCECGGRRFAVPQDAEARMFFFNKNLMRQAGFSDEEIESLGRTRARRRGHPRRHVGHRATGGREDRRRVRDPAPTLARARLPHDLQPVWLELPRSRDRQAAARGRQDRRRLRLVRAQRSRTG